MIEVAAYESFCPNKMPEKTIQAIKKEVVDAILFCSGKTVANTAKLLTENIGIDWLDKIKQAKIISIGPQTTKSCMKFLKRTDQEAKPHNLEGLTKACITAIGRAF